MMVFFETAAVPLRLIDHAPLLGTLCGGIYCSHFGTQSTTKQKKNDSINWAIGTLTALIKKGAISHILGYRGTLEAF